MTDFLDLARKTLGELADADSVKALSSQFTLVDRKARDGERERAAKEADAWRKHCHCVCDACGDLADFLPSTHDAAPRSSEGCICAAIIASDERRHFRECPLRAKYPDPPEKR